MVIQEEELKKCLLFVLKPYLLKYGFHVLESSLMIENKISLKSILNYQGQNFYLDVSFFLDYKDGAFVFSDIEGKIKHSLIELPFMNVFKQFIHIPSLEIRENQCCYPISLPIEKIEKDNHQLIIKIRD